MEKLAILSKHPMYLFASSLQTATEVAIKREVDAYLINEVNHTERIRLGDTMLDVRASMDLPDAICDGLTFKQRVVRCDEHCFLLARWKPDRYMRRAAAGACQKWFLDKEFFPEDPKHFMNNLAETG